MRPACGMWRRFVMDGQVEAFLRRGRKGRGWCCRMRVESLVGMAAVAFHDVGARWRPSVGSAGVEIGVGAFCMC